MPRKATDRTSHIGRKFGMLTLISIEGSTAVTKCDCGKTHRSSIFNLLKGSTKSCGCNRQAAIEAKKVRDLTGQRFGRLVAVRRTTHKTTNGFFWQCECDCGGYAIVALGNLTTNTRSCGCLARETIGALNRTHGQSRSRPYKAHIQRNRDAAKLQRTPAWADMEAIRIFYANCPAGKVVDHIVPLQGKRVSGLHVANNLQYLTQSENSSKKNKF